MSDFAAILDHLPGYMLVCCRIGGLLIFAPILGLRSVPVRIRVGLSLLVGMVAYPTLAEGFATSPVIEADPWLLAPVAFLEAAVGVLIGYMAAIPMVAVQVGGKLMGQQMGLAFAEIYNPASDSSDDALGQMLFFLALATFLMMDGHEAMIFSVLRTFEYVDLGAFRVNDDIITLLTGLLLSALDVGLRIAAPILAIVFLESVAMGFMAKTTPQLNILSLGFPLRILAGIATFMVGIGIVHGVIIDTIAQVLDVLFTWSAPIRGIS